MAGAINGTLSEVVTSAGQLIIINLTNHSDISGNNQSSSNKTVEKCLCKELMEDDLYESGVRYWDVALLCPQVVFLLFLCIKLQSSVKKLFRYKSHLFMLMYILVWVDTTVAVVRAVAAVAMRSAVERGDQILWLTLNFFFIATETAVLAFAVLFGHLDSAKGVRRVLIVSLLVACISTIIMTVLEFQTTSGSYRTSFHHGTLSFMIASTVVFLLIYISTLLLPWSPWRGRFLLPSKLSFYIYCASFVVLDTLQLIGASLAVSGINAGYCLLDITIFTYMTLLPAGVYFVYLRGYFANSQLAIPFSFDDPSASTTGINEEDGNSSLPSTPFSLPRHLIIQLDNNNNSEGNNQNIQNRNGKGIQIPVPQNDQMLDTTLPSMSL